MGKFVCDQDEEDFEQERRIQKWLDSTGNSDRIELEHINRNGRARNTLVRASFSLDQKVSEDSKGTFADLIAGNPDGASSLRDFSGDGPGAASATLDAYLALLGFDEEKSEWLIKTLKSSVKTRRARSRKSQIDSELWEQLTNYEL